ncbi:MAG: GDP-mannose 4,6-dehydratase [Gemmatimonadota bacterium]|nr:GDP-mannose 4,6-dehydratase [Gemmatimonadota bacterium]
MRALVTGATGFVGPWLCRELLARGWEVTGTVHGDPAAEPLAAIAPPAGIDWVQADLRRQADVRAAVEASAPDAIFHLAGVAYVPAASADPGAALEVNVIAAARLLAEVRTRRQAGTLDPVVLIVGSGLQYGRHEVTAMPLREDAAQRPQDLYAASKAAQEIVALEAFHADGVRVIATRSFNHAGPGQEPRYLIPRLVREALALRRSGGTALTLGNITPVRDFLHVADVARAYVALVERGAPGEAYNVASGAGVDVRTVADRVLVHLGIDARLHIDPALQRSADVPVLVGDPAKLRGVTGWAPQHSLDSIIEDLIRAAAS